MKKPARYFITGNGTGVGKTLVAAVLCEALQADYWKPVQCGNLNHTDSDFVREHVSNSVSNIHPETWKLQQPVSPHAAAKAEEKKIRLKDFQLPETCRPLIIEGAGGLLVPVNNRRTMADLINRLQVPVIVVCRNYLGSINHSLLTLEILRRRRLKVAGIIFNGEPNPESERIIIKRSGAYRLGCIPGCEKITKQEVKRLAMQWMVFPPQNGF